MKEFGLALMLARRDLRGGMRAFRLFLACLAVGVAAIAGVGSLRAALVAGLEDNARALLGGEAEIRSVGQDLDQRAKAWLDANTTRRSIAIELRAMAQAENDRTLVELKAVDAQYPLYGKMTLDPPLALDLALADRGAVVEPTLLERLGLGVGDKIKIGESEFAIRAAIRHEPDRTANAFSLGPRFMIAVGDLGATDLIRPGALIRWAYRVGLPEGSAPEIWRAKLSEAFPEASWVVRDLRNSQPALKRWLDRLGVFLALVGLTALLIGGIGVGNAVHGYLDGKVGAIATLKCLGAPGPLVFRVYLLQVLALALVGVLIGLVLGAFVPFLVAWIVGERLPVPPSLGLFPVPLGRAALFGVLVSLLFALWPLARARDVPAAGLFRAIVSPASGWPRKRYLGAIVATAAALALLAVFGDNQARFATWFVLGAAGALAAFRATALGLVEIGRRLPRPRRPLLRLALANLTRPGAPTASVLLSLGIGLTVLVAVASIDGNLARQIADRIPDKAPSFFFIDIQPAQADAFEETLRARPGIDDIVRVPTLRGRIVRAKGRPLSEIKVGPGSEWATRGDLGFSYRARMPEGTRLTAGSWWSADYAGEPLISLDAAVGADMGLALGDEMTFSILGREVAARIANFREVDWSEFGLNFVVIFAPGALEGAPQIHVASARAVKGTEEAIFKDIGRLFPNVSTIRVKEVIEHVASLLDRIAAATRATAAVTLAAGAIVLAGAIAAGHRRRVYDSVLLKVLGATRREILGAYLAEFAALGIAAALIAGAIGSVTAWAVMVPVMGSEWHFVPASFAWSLAVGLAMTLIFGFVGTWRALGQKAAPVLRSL